LSAYDEIEKIIFRFGVEAATKGGQEACDRVEYGHRFHFEDADALRYLMENAITLSRSSMDRLKGNIDAVIEAGLRDGKPLREVTKDVQAVFENFKGWEAERIARTEIARATNAGAISGYREMGVGVAEVVANAGACTKCAALNGELYPTDQAMRVLPRHPNCYCFWIPRPDITSGNIKGYRSLGEITSKLADGLGLETAFRRVCMGPNEIRKIESKSAHHLGYERARIILETSESGFIDTHGDICVVEHVEEGWAIIPFRETKTRGYQARTAYWNSWEQFSPKLEKVVKRYGF